MLKFFRKFSKNNNFTKIIGGVLLVLLFLNLLTSFDLLNTGFRFFFIFLTFIFAKLLEFAGHDDDLNLSWFHLSVMGLLFTSVVITIFFENQIFAWLFLIIFFAVLISIAEKIKGSSLIIKIFNFLSLAFFAGFVPVIINQMLVRFSDEEFYTAIMMAGFSVLWLLLYIFYHYLVSDLNFFPIRNYHEFIHLKTSATIWFLWGVVIILSFIAINSYQRSFFPKDVAPLYSGITDETPFICGMIDGNDSEQGSDGKFVQSKFATLLASKENLTTNDYAFLALYEQNESLAEVFKQRILLEAENRNFTEPAKSIKYDQYLAAQTIYYYEEIKNDFPRLFDETEIRLIEEWIELVNERALTIELVDVFYGLAFSQKPVGAYQNQAIGAGLYAQLLNAKFKNDLDLEQNKIYLDKSDFGWDRGFRVLDDSINYQPVWITNAYLYSLYSGTESQFNQKLSFEWLLYQALPDGNLMSYNFPFKISLGPVSLLSANILNDGRFLWLAEQVMQRVEDPNYYYAQVGSEIPIDENLRSEMPTVGSCLLYGDSGLPGNAGSLAPDKVVFRDGWEDDDLYMLINLRFTGWHRYKSTNAIVLVYAGQELVKEQYTQNLIPWLPVGRAMVRDKRIPIEQLNTLLIHRAGLDAVLNTIIDWFGPYAQDPPFYSEIESFGTSAEVDHLKTTIKDWHGWQFERSIFFYHDGPVFIFDNASSKRKSEAAINLHLSEGYFLHENRAINSDTDVDFLFINQENGTLLDVEEDDCLLVQYQSEELGTLNLLTVILPDEWQKAEFVSYEDGIIVFLLDNQTFEYTVSEKYK